MLRILHRRKLQSTQNQALRSLQLLVNECQSMDVKVNRAIMVIQEIELVSRGYRLSTPLAPISRIEQASKTRRCNMVRAQLVAALTKSGALFQKSTETLQSHIDHKRLSTLLDMYNITPSSRPNSPGYLDGAGANVTGTFDPTSPIEHRQPKLTIQTQTTNLANDSLTLIASPVSDTHMPLPSHYTHHARQHSASKRRSRTMTGGSNRSRPSSYHEPSLNSPLINAEQQRFLAFEKRPSRRHHTSWSASEGEDSDTGSFSMASPRSSIYSNADAGGSSLTASSPEMTSLERLRKNFQKMHGFRREFLCELLSIRRKSRKGRQGLHHALKDYDQNWTVVRDILREGLQGIESVVTELSKVLDTELYTLPRIDTQGNNNSSPRDKQLQPFVQRLALLEQHVRGVQAKLYICNEDIKESVRQDIEKRRLLELQYDSISQDIGMMASEWQLGKTALNNVFELPKTLPAQGSDSPFGLSDLQGGHGLGLSNALGGYESLSMAIGPVVDSMETLEDQQRLMALAAKREETWEASTESGPTSLSRRFGFATGADGSATAKMTRAERIAHQKLLREQEEATKERVYDNTKMVHELKDVLGRRRHLRENDDDTTPASGSSSIPTAALEYSLVAAGSLAEQLAQADNDNDREGEQSISGRGQQQHQQLSLAEEFSASSLSSERISLFSSDAPMFTSGSNSFMSFMESSIGPMEESIVEITGVGEADDEEEKEEQEEVEEEDAHDVESDQAHQI
ncbi:MAG: Mysoin-binding motif of peroxisomes-domain-containing protein [Linnemannia gamsii]|nr:MAG: Mysoin-binding motif of peroxisomes-domain-containing protein [Linnemannia gamsii]